VIRVLLLLRFGLGPVLLCEVFHQRQRILEPALQPKRMLLAVVHYAIMGAHGFGSGDVDGAGGFVSYVALDHQPEGN
jgi:hypothetical protein